jgi:hypothetical protein
MSRAEVSSSFRKRRKPRAGIALATTLYFLVLLALLVVGTLYSARAAGVSGELLIEDAELTAATERLLTDAISSWPARDRAGQPIATSVRQTVAVDARITGAISTTRLSTRFFWIVADVGRAVDAAGRRSSIIVRLVDDGPAVSAALVARGDVLLGGGAIVEGARDSGDCSPFDSTLAAIEVGTGALVRSEDVTPLPSWRASDLAASDVPYEQLGGRTWAQMPADLEIEPGAVLTPMPSPSGECGAPQAPDDWGEPLGAGACASWVPVIHARGDLTIAGGRGQGILLVEGRLRVTGALRFRGLIVSRGDVEMRADGVEISGAILSGASTNVGAGSGSSVVIRGRVTLRASRCDVTRAFAAHTSVRRVRERAWMELW